MRLKKNFFWGASEIHQYSAFLFTFHIHHLIAMMYTCFGASFTSVCGKINVHTIAAQKYIAPQAA